MSKPNWFVDCLQRRCRHLILRRPAVPGARALAHGTPVWLLALVIATAPACDRPAPRESSRQEVREVVRRPVRERQVAQIDRETTPTAFEQVAADAADTGEGFVYLNDRVRSGPWSVSLLRIDRSRSDLELTTSLGRGRTLGLSTLSEQMERIPSDVGLPLAAVNGDFYRTEHERYPGDPRGLQIYQGELISAPSGKAAFWIDADGNPSMGTVTSQMKVTWPDGETTPIGLNEERRSNNAILYTWRAGPSTRGSGGREFILVRPGDGPWLPLRAGETITAEVREIRESGNSRLNSDILVLSIGRTLLPRIPDVAPGDLIEISTATSPDLRGAQTALGGGPVLVRGGKVQSVHSNKAHERHPRSALGWNDDYFFLAQVDGRQRGFSVGMTLPELANYLKGQGCDEAMNLDGGGSSEMWVKGRVVNRPCFGYERDTANALVLVRHERVAAE